MNKFVITTATRNANLKASTIQIGKSDPENQLPVSYIERALLSARQDYPDYRIIVRDDASTDGTWEIIQRVAETFDVPIDIASNPQRLGTIMNHNQISKLIDDDEIIVILDGDDQLAHRDVLTRLNMEYSDPEVWMTYGSFEYDECSRSKEPGASARGFASQMNSHNRLSGFSCSHLRSYKKWLYDRIELEDLKYKDDFYPNINDYVVMFIMIEMAGAAHSRYIHDILYLYNNVNPYNEFKGPGAWPTDTEEQRAIKEQGETKSGHSKILIHDEINELVDYFSAQRIYPPLQKAKDYPWK